MSPTDSLLLLSALPSGHLVAEALLRNGLMIAGIVRVNEDLRRESAMRADYFFDFTRWGEVNDVEVFSVGTLKDPAFSFTELAPALLSGNLVSAPQDSRRAAWTRRRRPEDGRIERRQTSTRVHNLTGALARPLLGAATESRRAPLRILGSALAQEIQKLETPGTVVSTLPVLVSAGSYLMQLETVGSDTCGDASAWVRRMRVATGERLG